MTDLIANSGTARILNRHLRQRAIEQVADDEWEHGPWAKLVPWLINYWIEFASSQTMTAKGNVRPKGRQQRYIDQAAFEAAACIAADFPGYPLGQTVLNISLQLVEWAEAWEALPIKERARQHVEGR